MKRISLILFCLLFAQSVIGQKYFEVYFENSINFNDFYAETDTIWGVGNFYNDLTAKWEAVLYEIVGAEVQEIARIANDSLDHFGMGLSGNNSYLIIAGSADFEDGTRGPAYFVYNRQTGDQSIMPLYIGGGVVRHIKKLSNGDFLIGGFAIYPDFFWNWVPLLARVSPTGQFLWRQFYEDYPPRASWAVPYETSSGELLVPGFIDAPFDVSAGVPILVSIDGEGNILQELTYEEETMGYFGEILEGIGENLFITGDTGETNDCVYKLNADKEIEWIVPLSFENTCGPSNLYFTHQGHLQVAQCYSDPNELGSTDARINIIDTSGFLIRSVIYGGDAADYFYGMTPTPDGAFLYGGRTDSYEGSQAYLVKANCMGFLTEPEAHFTYSLNGLELQVENQSQFVYPDSIDGGHYLWYLEGELASSERHPVLNLPESGAYNLELLAVVCSDTSRMLSCISLDGSECADLTAITDFEIPTIQITPNPATNQLTAQLPMGYIDCSFIVHDLKGKQVMAAGELANNATELKLDVSAYPVGIYVLQFMNKEKEQLAQSRFVKQ